MTDAFWIFVLRFGQAAIAGAPGVLAGVMIAGMLGTLIPAGTPDSMRRGTLRRLVSTRLLLFLVPLTSLGSLFVAERLRRMHYPTAVVLLALLSGGFAPWVIAWGMSQAGFSQVLVVLAAASVVPVVAAVIASRFARAIDAPAADEGAPPATRSVWNVLADAGNAIRSADVVHVLAGLTVSAAVAVLMPAGFLEGELGVRSPAALLLAAGVASAVVTTPEQAMTFAWQAIDIGTIPGSAIAWLVLGGGFHLGSVTWIAHRFAPRVAAMAWVTVVAAALIASAAVDPILFRHLPDDPDTHAFDVLTRPYHIRDKDGAGPMISIARFLRRDLFPNAPSITSPAIFCLAALVALAALAPPLSRMTRPRGAVAGVSAPRSLARPRWSCVVVAGATVAWLVVGVYTYFPRPETTILEIRQASAEMYPLIVRGKRELAAEKADRLQGLIRRWTIGLRLREPFALDRHSTRAARELATSLASYSDDLNDLSQEEAVSRYVPISRDLVRLRR